MRVSDLISLLQKLPQDYDCAYLCPDGYQDYIEHQFDLDDESKEVMFLSYVHRPRWQDKEVSKPEAEFIKQIFGAA